VVWEDFRDGPTRGSDIYARRVNERGRPVGDDTRVSSRGATEADRDPIVAFGSTCGQHLVAWIDQADFQVEGRRTAK
jgi:hypothetical protein